jgi:hypothetical protein
VGIQLHPQALAHIRACSPQRTQLRQEAVIRQGRQRYLHHQLGACMLLQPLQSQLHGTYVERGRHAQAHGHGQEQRALQQCAIGFLQRERGFVALHGGAGSGIVLCSHLQAQALFGQSLHQRLLPLAFAHGVARCGVGQVFHLFLAHALAAAQPLVQAGQQFAHGHAAVVVGQRIGPAAPLARANRLAQRLQVMLDLLHHMHGSRPFHARHQHNEVRPVEARQQCAGRPSAAKRRPTRSATGGRQPRICGGAGHLGIERRQIALANSSTWPPTGSA